ncbi:hypothetical protein GYA19_04100, partial [Candidatus Beckwithbacteria bacterium]|nr:hypothetical protein [Candidatus Beckwithbacteria bacterium]
NKGLYIYTRHDIEGIKDSKQSKGYSGVVHFMTDNNLVAGCPKDGGLCKQSIYENVIINYGNYTSAYDEADSDQNAQNLAILTAEKVYFFIGDNKAWEKDVLMRGDPLSVSVSPGGKYVIFSTEISQEPYRIFKIFTDNNVDKTFTQPNKNEDVVFVHANDKGLFYATKHNRTLKYYQIGSYTTEYNPASPAPSATPNSKTSALSYWSDGTWHQASQQSFNNLVEGAIYLANQNITLDMGGANGSLFILKDTLFSVDNYQHPILLKGQMTADFASPQIVYALKFDRFDMQLFQSKLNLFRANRLNADEYFVVKNVHTKFRLTNLENNFNVAVDTGEVQVLNNKKTETITSGKQISIDKDNQVKESIYLGWKLYAIIAGVFALISGVLLFVYRKTKVGRTTLSILQTILKTILKVLKFSILLFKIIFNTFCKLIKKQIKKRK